MSNVTTLQFDTTTGAYHADVDTTINDTDNELSAAAKLWAWLKHNLVACYRYCASALIVACVRIIVLLVQAYEYVCAAGRATANQVRRGVNHVAQRIANATAR